MVYPDLSLAPEDALRRVVTDSCTAEARRELRATEQDLSRTTAPTGGRSGLGSPVVRGTTF